MNAAEIIEEARSYLPPRQLQILRMLARGKSTAEISKEMFIAENTVKAHTRSLREHLGAHNRAHAVGLGFAYGILAVGDVGAPVVPGASATEHGEVS